MQCREKDATLAFSLNFIVSEWDKKQQLDSSVINLLLQQLSRDEGNPDKSTIGNIYSVFMYMQ